MTRRERERIIAAKKNKSRTIKVALVIITVFAIVLGVGIVKLYIGNKEDEQRIAELENQVKAEQSRAEELDEREDTIDTDEFVISEARRLYNLSFPDDIVFSPKK